MKIRKFLRKSPLIVNLWRYGRYVGRLGKSPGEVFVRRLGKSPEEIFTEIYRKNLWGDAESVSGGGSNLAQTEAVREALPRLLAELGCQLLLDIPCGDFYWMSRLDLTAKYTGADIVADLVVKNQQAYGNARRQFIKRDLLADSLPQSDLLLCRDCLVHLSNADIFRALKNSKASGAGYLLTTTFTARTRNDNIPTGWWRPINLQRAPFNFPPPATVINERCPEEGFEDKSLGLWKVEELPL